MKFEHNPRCFPLDSEAKMVNGKRVYATPNGEFILQLPQSLAAMLRSKQVLLSGEHV